MGIHSFKPKGFFARARNFRFSFVGAWSYIRHQHNAWILVFVTLAIVAMGISFGLNRNEWCWVILGLTSVWVAEGLNTALEFLADAVSNEYNPLIKEAKDIAAGAVLFAIIGSLLIGVFIFGPHIRTLF